MKKLLLLSAILILGSGSMFAQNNYGVFVNYSNLSFDGEDNTSGFSGGLFAEFGISEEFSVQPEVSYLASTLEDQSYNLFGVNAMAKYTITEGLNILAGPQLNFASGDIPDALDENFPDDFSSLNFQLAIGVSYDFTDNIFAQARYAFQINEHVEDLTGSINILTVGAGYKF